MISSAPDSDCSSDVDDRNSFHGNFFQGIEEVVASVPAAAAAGATFAVLVAVDVFVDVVVVNATLGICKKIFRLRL